MKDTSGFYRYEDGVLAYAHSKVYTPSVTLERAEHTRHTYPVDGWEWFESLEEAQGKCGITNTELSIDKSLFEQIKKELQNIKIDISNGCVVQVP